MDSHQEYVLREVAQKNIRFIRLWFTDVAGVLKSISIDPGELEEAFSEGIGFDGSAVEGLTTSSCPMVAQLPRIPEGFSSARWSAPPMPASGS